MEKLLRINQVYPVSAKWDCQSRVELGNLNSGFFKCRVFKIPRDTA